MANGFKMFVLSFESERRGIGSEVATLLNRYVDIESGDLLVDDKKLELRIVLSASVDSIHLVCDEIKKELEKTGDYRVLYHISIVS